MGSFFQNSLKKRKKQLKNFWHFFVIFSLKAVCGCWSLKCWLFFAGVSTDSKVLEFAPFCVQLTLYLCLGYTGLRVQLSVRAREGRQNSSSPRWAAALLSLSPHWGTFKFSLWGFCSFLSLFFLSGRLGLFIWAITSMLVSVAGIKTKQTSKQCVGALAFG